MLRLVLSGLLAILVCLMLLIPLRLLAQPPDCETRDCTYLPLIQRATTPTPTLTLAPSTETPEPSPTPSPLPTATPAPLPPSFNACQEDPNKARAPQFPIVIVAIDKEAEVVTLRNMSGISIDLDGWTMCSIRGNQTHDGIGDQGQVIVQSGEIRDFDYVGEGNIWRNDLCDDGALYDGAGSLVSYWVDADSC